MPYCIENAKKEDLIAPWHEKVDFIAYITSNEAPDQPALAQAEQGLRCPLR